MSVYHGNDGVVKSGTTAIGELQGWTYDETMDIAERTSCGDTAATYVPSGCKKGGGTIDVLLDEDDAGQLLMLTGAEITLSLYGEGTTAGDFEYSGSAVVASNGRKSSKDGLNTMSFAFQGVLTRAAVSA